MAWGWPALEAEAKTVKAMKTLAAKAMGMTPETNTMKAMKTPAAKAKGMKPDTKTTKDMKTPAANAKMKPDTATEIIIDGAIRLTTPMSPCEILRYLQPQRRRVSVIDGAIHLTPPVSPYEMLRCLLPPRRRVSVWSEPVFPRYPSESRRRAAQEPSPWR